MQSSVGDDVDSYKNESSEFSMLPIETTYVFYVSLQSPKGKYTLCKAGKKATICRYKSCIYEALPPSAGNIDSLLLVI